MVVVLMSTDQISVCRVLLSRGLTDDEARQDFSAVAASHIWCAFVYDKNNGEHE